MGYNPELESLSPSTACEERGPRLGGHKGVKAGAHRRAHRCPLGRLPPPERLAGLRRTRLGRSPLPSILRAGPGPLSPPLTTSPPPAVPLLPPFLGPPFRPRPSRRSGPVSPPQRRLRHRAHHFPLLPHLILPDSACWNAPAPSFNSSRPDLLWVTLSPSFPEKDHTFSGPWSGRGEAPQPVLRQLAPRARLTATPRCSWRGHSGDGVGFGVWGPWHCGASVRDGLRMQPPGGIRGSVDGLREEPGARCVTPQAGSALPRYSKTPGYGRVRAPCGWSPALGHTAESRLAAALGIA